MLKLLIVEDEPNTRHALVHNYDWNQLGYEVCADFQSGSEALPYLQTHPVDVLLTDIVMQNMSGLELIEEVRKLNLPIECVVISAYNDFAFAQIAIKCRVSSYLLKPIEEAEVHALFDSLRKQILQKQQQSISSEHMRQLLEHSSLDLAEKALENYLKQISWQEESINLLLTYYGCMRSDDHFALALLEMPFNNFPDGKSIVTKWYTETFHRTCITFPYGNYHILLMAFPADFSFVEITRRACCQLKLRMILSAPITSIFDLPDKYTRLCSLSDRLFLLPEGTLENDATPMPSAAPMPDTNEYAHFLAHAIRDQSQADIDLQMRRFWTQISQALPSSDLAVITLTELFYVLSDLLTEEGKKGMFSFNEIFKRFKSSTSLIMLQQQANIILDELSAFFYHHNRADISERIKAYIDEHYADHLSITDLAQKFYFSPNHLGMKFQQETGITISRYIKQVRLRNARKQLIETNNYIREIATNCGFASYQSFCTAFQEEYHVTPRYYRAINHGSHND